MIERFFAFDNPFTWLVISFCLFLAIFLKSVFPRIRDIVRVVSQQITSEFQRLHAHRSDSQQKLLEEQKNFHKTQKKAQELHKKTRALIDNMREEHALSRSKWQKGMESSIDSVIALQQREYEKTLLKKTCSQALQEMAADLKKRPDAQEDFLDDLLIRFYKQLDIEPNLKKKPKAKLQKK